MKIKVLAGRFVEVPTVPFPPVGLIRTLYGEVLRRGRGWWITSPTA